MGPDTSVPDAHDPCMMHQSEVKILQNRSFSRSEKLLNPKSKYTSGLNILLGFH